MAARNRRTNKHKRGNVSRSQDQRQTTADLSSALTHEQTETGPQAPSQAPSSAQGERQAPPQGVQRNSGPAQRSFRITYEDYVDVNDDGSDDLESLDPSHVLSTMRFFLKARRLFDDLPSEAQELLDLIQEATTRQLKALNTPEGLYLIKADLDRWDAHDARIHQAHIRMYRQVHSLVLCMDKARPPADKAELRSSKLSLLEAMRQQTGWVSDKIAFVEELAKSRKSADDIFQNSVRLRDPDTSPSDKITNLSACHSLSIAERILKVDGLFDNLPLERDRALARIFVQAQRTIEMVNLGVSTVMTRPADRIREQVLHNRISNAHDLMLHRLRPITTIRQQHPLVLAAKPLATPKSLSKVPKEIRRRRVQMGALEAIEGLAEAAAGSIDFFFDLPMIMSMPEFFDSLYVRILA
ncbi:hypothetical protein EMPS_04271 [Entomortierella parvispora]|uniref:Uncharacterized protein n=1 Tax=Entomortierella parvispora TaxID=205924 RepID=A0A9P3H895_9FUNG|nr:hypothetical protein EMPS_04271 [Entomortierella parvispora]